MAKDISSRIWLLQPNADGTLDSRYPTGDKPSEAVQAPTITLGLVTDDAIQILISGGANIVSLVPRRDGTPLPPIATNANSYTFTGLAPETEYDLDLEADGEGGPVYSNTLTAETDESPAGMLFEDDFERTSLLPYSDRGLAWNSAANVSTQTTEAMLGSRSARFRYPADIEPVAELSMDKRESGLGLPNLTEFSLRYALKLPTNWEHESGNNKGIAQFWVGPYDTPGPIQFIGFEYWPTGDGASSLGFRWYLNGKERHFHGMTPIPPEDMWAPDAIWPGTAANSMFKSTDPGKRMQFRVYVKLASEPEAIDGIIRVWKWTEGDLAPELVLDITTWGYSDTANYIDQMYILGAANSGFEEITDIYIDGLGLMENGLIDWIDWEMFNPE